MKAGAPENSCAVKLIHASSSACLTVNVSLSKSVRSDTEVPTPSFPLTNVALSTNSYALEIAVNTLFFLTYYQHTHKAKINKFYMSKFSHYFFKILLNHRTYNLSGLNFSLHLLIIIIFENYSYNSSQICIISFKSRFTKMNYMFRVNA